MEEEVYVAYLGPVASYTHQAALDSFIEPRFILRPETSIEDVFAAGDITNFPVKQGGIATQQADTVAAVIAASAGSDVDPHPFRPVLRGLLLTGGQPRYFRQEITRGVG